MRKSFWILLRCFKGLLSKEHNTAKFKKRSTESNNEQLIIDNNDAERIRRKELQLYKNLEQYKHYTRNN